MCTFFVSGSLLFLGYLNFPDFMVLFIYLWCDRLLSDFLVLFLATCVSIRPLRLLV